MNRNETATLTLVLISLVCWYHKSGKASHLRGTFKKELKNVIILIFADNPLT